MMSAPESSSAAPANAESTSASTSARLDEPVIRDERRQGPVEVRGHEQHAGRSHRVRHVAGTRPLSMLRQRGAPGEHA